MTLFTVVYAKINAINAAPSAAGFQPPFSRLTESVTATAAEVMSTSTPVA